MARTALSLDHIMHKRRWTAEDGGRVLSALESSGESVTDFAARHGVQAQRIHLWRRSGRSVSRSRRGVEPVRFVQVAATVEPHAAPPRYELSFPNGAALRIEGTVDAGSVRTLLGLLRRATSC